MFRKFFLLVSVLSLSSCGWFGGNDEFDLCPIVEIQRNNSVVIQKAGYSDEFKIELTGFEGYCYFNDRTKKNIAVIRPVVKVTRIGPSDETDVHFSFYTEAVKGPPEFLGKRFHYTNVRIPASARQLEFSSKQVELEIPYEMVDDYDLNLGLAITKNEKAYNKKVFDK